MDFAELKKPEVLIELGLISIPVCLTGIASARLFLHHKRSFHRGDFYNMINISLNTIIRTPKMSTTASESHQSYKYTLYFRTLMEKEVRDVIPNAEGMKQLIDAAKRTDEENPLIVMKNENNHWTVCNQIANQISAMCAPSFIHRDIVYHNYINNKFGNNEILNNEIDDVNTLEMCSSGSFLSSIKGKNGVNIASNIESGIYCMALSCEPERSVRHRKIRVMLIQESMILQLLEDMKNESAENSVEVCGKERNTKLELEDPVHGDRWELIKKIAHVYDKQEKRPNGKIKWGKPLCDLELCTMSTGNNMNTTIEQAIEQSASAKWKEN